MNDIVAISIRAITIATIISAYISIFIGASYKMQRCEDWPCTITITYAESVENHIGNQQIGSKLPHGPSTNDLHLTYNAMEKYFNSRGIACPKAYLFNLSEHVPESGLDASVMVIRNLINIDLASALYMRDGIHWDSKYFDRRRGRVLNKNARWNTCFTDIAQEPNYEAGMGTVHAFDTLPPFMRDVRAIFSECIHIDGVPYSAGFHPSRPLYAEGNYYYDVNKCYIGAHGDVERSLVAGLRIGHQFPLHFQYYVPITGTGGKTQPTDLIHHIELNHGDAYIMSHDATGQNWLCKKPHFRHSAGFNIK